MELEKQKHYRPGRPNHAADALSHQVNNVTTGALVQAEVEDGTIHRLTAGSSEELESLASRQDRDAELRMIKRYLLTNQRDNFGS